LKGLWGLPDYHCFAELDNNFMAKDENHLAHLHQAKSDPNLPDFEMNVSKII
jgi:hypothetical protein